MAPSAITIGISTSNRGPLFQRLLERLRRQSVQPLEILTRGPEAEFRHQTLFEEAQGSLIVFLDEDCEPADPNWLLRVQTVFEQKPHLAGAGGIYLNPPAADYLTRSYHELCRAWVLSWALNSNTPPHLLGGCLVLNKKVIGSVMPRPAGSFWGGEETFFLAQLRNQGLSFQFFEELSVIHRPSSSLKHWLRRAVQHGRAKRDLKDFGLFQINRLAKIKFWLQNTNPIYWPPIIAHGLAGQTAILLKR